MTAHHVEHLEGFSIASGWVVVLCDACGHRAWTPRPLLVRLIMYAHQINCYARRRAPAAAQLPLFAAQRAVVGGARNDD